MSIRKEFQALNKTFVFGNRDLKIYCEKEIENVLWNFILNLRSYWVYSYFKYPLLEHKRRYSHFYLDGFYLNRKE